MVKHPWSPHLADDIPAVAYFKFDMPGSFHVLLTTNLMLVEQRRYHHAFK